jgi:predicted alpha/beta hydrolase
VLHDMDGRRVSFLARDGSRLGGVVAVPGDAGAHRAAIVLMAPGDTIANYDSLGVALVQAGFATLFLDVRGSGWSVSPTCPSPDTWAEREEALQHLVARDVRAALGELATHVPIDTTRYLVAGVGGAASMAVEAAALDSRVGALLLVSPKPEAVERGPMRARLAKLQLPTFFQVGQEDFTEADVTDALYQAGNRSASRVVEARFMGSGALVFHNDPTIAARFTRWLDDVLPRSGRRGAPPTRPPGG